MKRCLTQGLEWSNHSTNTFYYSTNVEKELSLDSGDMGSCLQLCYQFIV